jgi:ABC-type lipoprotein export system ATPase subunit
MLEMRQVAKVFSGSVETVNAIVDIDLKIEAGEVAAIHGPSGCGKTTLLLIAGAMMKPTRGNVLIDQVNPYELDSKKRAKLRGETIGFVFQQFNLIPYLSVFENVILSARPGQNKSKIKDKAKILLERFDLMDRVCHKPGELSTGQQQRTALARALINDPKLILADEPTGNLDKQNAGIVIEHLHNIAQQGAAVLIVTHDSIVDKYCFRKVNIDDGRICEQEKNVKIKNHIKL